MALCQGDIGAVHPKAVLVRYRAQGAGTRAARPPTESPTLVHSTPLRSVTVNGTHEFRKVTLRDERAGKDSRHLWAYVDEAGNLHIDGQDLGPGTAPISPDGEYEWFKTIAAVDVPRLVSLLGGTQGEDVLDLLERSFSGAGSYELETRLRESDIPVEFFSC